VGDNPPAEVGVKHGVILHPQPFRAAYFQRELAFRAIGVDVEGLSLRWRG
jgi:4'-phosphopantetheinyl transferase EntD